MNVRATRARTVRCVPTDRIDSRVHVPEGGLAPRVIQVGYNIPYRQLPF